MASQASKHKLLNYAWIPVIFVHLLMLLELKFTAWPEMLLWPYLLAKGWLPYVNIAIAHTPNLVIVLAIFYKIFGTGVIQPKIFTWLIIVLTDYLVYRIANKIWKRKIALFSLIIFVLWQMFFEGNGLWFDLLLAPLSLITYYLFNKKYYFWTGIFLGIMFFTKQTAVWFVIPILLSLVNFKKLKINLKIFKIVWGGLFFLIVGLIALWIWKVLPSFYFWGIKFGIFILPKSQGQVSLPDIKTLAVSGFPFLIFIPLIWKTKTKYLNLLFWSAAGTLGAYPRFEFFHFQPAVTFLAIASGIVISEFSNFKGILRTVLIIYIVGSLYLFANFILRDWGEGTRFIEQDVIDVSNYVKQNTNQGDKIFVMNWWDNIYPLTGTLPATNPWVPQLSWYQDLPGIQEKEVIDLKSSKPKMILLNPYTESGLSAYIPQQVYDFVAANYKIAKKVDGIEILVPK